VLPMQGDRKPVPFLQTEFGETMGQISPDGRWMAYTSNESGQQEVYVQSFPRGSGPEGKWKVSTAGGHASRWRQDGKELFYLDAGGRLMAVAVKTAAKSAFEMGAPEPLFETRNPPLLSFGYQPSADGQRFVVAESQGSTQAPFTVVSNWQRAAMGDK